MKQKVMLIMLIALPIILIGCSKTSKNESDIVSFSYDYGSFTEGYYKYSITVENDKVLFSAKGLNGINMNINKEIDASYLDNLSEIINDKEIYKWDGFDEKDNSILDGYSFSLKVEYADETTLKADGYMRYPNNYDEGHKKILEFIETIK